MTAGLTISTPLALASTTSPGPRDSSCLKFLTYNAHLFAGAGIARDPHTGTAYRTGFIYEDEERADLIPQCIRALSPDVVGLTETWHPQVRQQIIAALRDIYPYHYSSQGLEGIGEIFRSLEARWPKTATALKHLLPWTPRLVQGLSSWRYDSDQSSLLSGVWENFREIGAEDTLYRGLKWLVNPDTQWHAFDDALLLLSRYPISNPTIQTYQARADHEHFVRKGILKADIHPPQSSPITVLLTHNQEGETVQARRARHLQVRKLRQLRQASPYRVVLMGDLNEVREQWLAEQLDMIDAYRRLYPDPAKHPGYTFDSATPYAKQQGVALRNNSRLRIDYVFADHSLIIRTSQIRRDEFRHPQKEYDLSDHFPVEAEVEVA